MEGFFIAQITPWGASFAPRGWSYCDGQLLAVNQNDALFSLLGTIYGGDGRTTFGLPDLRGRVPIGAGSGPGLSPRRLGAKGGAESVTLTVPTLASHDHAAPVTLEAADASADDPGPSPAVRFARGNSAFGDVDLYSSAAPDTGLQSPGGVTSGQTGSTGSHTNIQPSAVVSYIIALTGLYPSRT